MPVLSKIRRNSLDKKTPIQKECFIKKGDIVKHGMMKAEVLWVNNDHSHTAAIKYIFPFDRIPTNWRISISELTLIPQKIHSPYFNSGKNW